MVLLNHWKKQIKRAVAPLAARAPRWKVGTQAVIVCYHAVGPKVAPEVVGRAQFERQMDILLQRFSVVPLDELVSEIANEHLRARNCIAVTFDDGYRNILEHALPILRERGLHATTFVLPGLWGRRAHWPTSVLPEDRILWDVDDAREWKAAGMSLGSHGMTHIDLSVAPTSTVRAEVVESKVALEAEFGPIAGFCYPWARHSPTSILEVRAAGYRYAVGGGYATRHRVSDLWSLGRITVDHDDTVRDFELKVLGAYDWLDSLGKMRAKVFR